jgi:hypothetical protein
MRRVVADRQQLCSPPTYSTRPGNFILPEPDLSDRNNSFELT